MDALSLIATTAGAVLVIALALHVWYAMGLSRVLAAHGGESWRAWVPLVNEAEVFRLGRIDPVRAVLLVVPFVNVYALVLKARAARRLGQSAGRGAGTTALAVILPPAWAMLLARRSEGADAEPSAPARITDAESASAEVAEEGVSEAGVIEAGDAEAPGPIVAVPGAPAPATAAAPAIAAAPAAAAGGRRASATSAEPYAPPSLAGPREIDPAAAEPQAPPAAGDDAPASDTGTTVPDAEMPIARAESSAATGASGAADDVDGRISETTDATAERSAGRTDVADPLDESTQTARPRSRRRGEWTLALPDGGTASLTSRTVVLGRRPSDHDEMTQYVAVVDETRTMSKEHARLDWTVTGWTITDLDSTNGVTLVHDDGRVERLPGGGTAAVPSRFRLGDAGLELRPAGG